jgi:copper chaperone CopZ
MAGGPASRQLRVAGMLCPHCADNVADNVASIVRATVEVDLASGIVTIGESESSDDAIRQVIEELGFMVVPN